MFKVELHSYSKAAIQATTETIVQLGGVLSVDEKFNATVYSDNDDYLKFALKNQGYVKEVLG